MYRILHVLFAMVVLFFVGAAHAENHDKSLHLILADDGRDGNGRTAGAVEVHQHGKDGRDGGTVIQRQEFPDITSLMAGYEDLYRQLFGDEETPCLLSKAQQGAVEGLVRTLAAELSPKIRVNCIAPSLTNTPLAAKILSSPERIEASNNRHPLKRIGEAHDVASAAAFLMSDDSSWITGQVIGVDGGLSTLR